MEVVNLKIPPRLIEEMDEVITEGWYANRGDVIRDALRDKLRQLKLSKLESAIMEDVEWGLSVK